MKINLREVPEEALLNELKRRQEIKELKPKLRPMEEITADISSDEAKRFILSILEDHEQEVDSVDLTQYVFEWTLELFFGKSIWDWWNEVDL